LNETLYISQLRRYWERVAVAEVAPVQIKVTP